MVSRLAPSSLAEVPQIDAAFIPVIGYYMISNIQWDTDALFQGTQAGNPRPDREEGLGAASREGRARYRRCRPDEGRWPHPWRILRAFRFAGSACHRGVRLCDGSVDGSLAQARGTNAVRQAPRDHRGFLS